MTNQTIDLHSAITALSCALDLVGYDEIKHGKRVAIMAFHIANHLGWPYEECLSIMHSGMLHDCGVAQMQERHSILNALEWPGAEAHAIRGAQYLQQCPPLAQFAEEVRYHHTRWEQLLTLPVSDRVRLRTNLLFLVDRVDMLLVPYLNTERVLTASEEILATVQDCATTLFSPYLLDALTVVAKSEAFWLALEPDYLDEDLRSLGKDVAPVSLDFKAQRELARLFSRVVDAKSHYTELHSERVATIARRLAQDFGIAGAELEQVEIAGLLHDLGKLRVSETIIDKPGKLTPDERASMQRHSYDTYRILQRVFSQSKIPIWAGFHHENLRGEGYPFKTASASQDLECRIITVADIFQALIQTRPYRRSMPLPEALQELERRVAAGELDAEVVERLKLNAESYYRLANG